MPSKQTSATPRHPTRLAAAIAPAQQASLTRNRMVQPASRSGDRYVDRKRVVVGTVENSRAPKKIAPATSVSGTKVISSKKWKEIFPGQPIPVTADRAWTRAADLQSLRPMVDMPGIRTHTPIRPSLTSTNLSPLHARMLADLVEPSWQEDCSSPVRPDQEAASPAVGHFYDEFVTSTPIPQSWSLVQPRAQGFHIGNGTTFGRPSIWGPAGLVAPCMARKPAVAQPEARAYYFADPKATYDSSGSHLVPPEEASTSSDSAPSGDESSPSSDETQLATPRTFCVINAMPDRRAVPTPKLHNSVQADVSQSDPVDIDATVNSSMNDPVVCATQATEKKVTTRTTELAGMTEQRLQTQPLGSSNPTRPSFVGVCHLLKMATQRRRLARLALASSSSEERKG